MAAVCPECDNPLSIDDDEVEEGETVQCDECGADLEIVAVDPIELVALEEAGYDESLLSTDPELAIKNSILPPPSPYFREGRTENPTLHPASDSDAPHEFVPHSQPRPRR